ncbi:MAG: hypothetical protein ACRDQ1_04855, partial [Sciscionella sp.]
PAAAAPVMLAVGLAAALLLLFIQPALLLRLAAVGLLARYLLAALGTRRRSAVVATGLGCLLLLGFGLLIQLLVVAVVALLGAVSARWGGDRPDTAHATSPQQAGDL